MPQPNSITAPGSQIRKLVNSYGFNLLPNILILTKKKKLTYGMFASTILIHYVLFFFSLKKKTADLGISKVDK